MQFHTYLGIGLLVTSAWGWAAPVDFSRDIRPIFSEKCTLCHGPDDAQGGLRLTDLDSAQVTLKSGKIAIVPGNADASEIIERIHHADPDSVMPPPGKAEPLTDGEKALLKQWINEGADWPRHWAYSPLDRPALSATNQTLDLHNPIDAFVAARLEHEGITPSPEADSITLIRRLYYDLIGLPPSVDQVDTYKRAMEQNFDVGYARLVDDLLASAHFGERWGRHWLDIARFADSDGYEKDNGRPDAWKYRDWVIDAINQDMPFDQFTIEQFAGDLLDSPTHNQHLATAFNRQTLTNTEGGTDKEQWRVAAVMDRVETVGAAWMGLTLTCARCHTHKYDEITHKEYYQLFAYFNNGDETNTQVPTSTQAWKDYKDATAIQESKISTLNARYEAKKAKLAGGIEHARIASVLDQADAFAPTVESVTINEVSGPDGVRFEPLSDGSYRVTGENPDTATYTITGTLPSGTISGLSLEVLSDPSLPGQGPGRAENGNFVLHHLIVSIDGKEQLLAGTEADFSQDNWPVSEAIDPAEGTGRGWAIIPESGKDHRALFGLSKPLHHKQADLPFEVKLIQRYGKQHTIGRFRLRVMTAPTELIVPKDIRELFRRDRELSLKELDQLNEYFARLDPVTRALANEIAELKAKLPKKPEMTVRVLKERGKDRRQTHVLHRGEFKQPTDQVHPGTLASLPSIAHRSGSDGDRLDFANWLVSGENPLPPRVVVNHLWAHLFGEGLVATLNDFGVRGERPSHPELLDWLAAELIDRGWSRKALIKTIVLSRTYRQSSNHRLDLADIDPKNRLLARQNRFRVEAEIVRDLSLGAAGMLTAKLGGPSVFPAMPAGVSDVNYNSAFKWKVSTGGDKYRRGLYTYFKRTAPHPNLMTFDCPDSNVTCIKRTRSNTPLAALITLNNDTFTEAARALAKRICKDDQPLISAFRHCLSRDPLREEFQQLLDLLEASTDYYAEHSEHAELLSPGAPERAPLTATVRILLNLDEFLTRN